MFSIQSVIQSLKDHSPVVILDDTAHTPCAYLCMPAEAATSEKLSFMINIGRGILMCPISESRAKALGLSSLGNTSLESFPITIGVESRTNITTGISAADRAETFKAIARSESGTSDQAKANTYREIIAPGHIFPLIAKSGGLLVKSSIAEAVLDLLDIAQQKAVGALTHILTAQGEFPSESEISTILSDHSLNAIRISEIIQYRLRNERLISKVASAKLPTEEFGAFQAHCYISHHDKAEHLVLTRGLEQNEPSKPTLVRMHSERKLGDLFLGGKIDGRSKLTSALSKINEKGRGALVYIRKNKSNFISTQLRNLSIEGQSETKSAEIEPTKAVELRELGIGAQMLIDLNIRELSLLSTSKTQTIDLSPFNVKIFEHIALNE